MSKIEEYIREHTNTHSNKTNVACGYYLPWLTVVDARKVGDIARKEAANKACKCYCDLICEKGRCGMCYIKNDGEGQVKNGFEYKGCLELTLIRNYTET